MSRIGSRIPKLRKNDRKVLKEKHHEQRALGRKLSSLRNILDKVSRGQMKPEVAYKTITVSLMEKKEVVVPTKGENVLIKILRKLLG